MKGKEKKPDFSLFALMLTGIVVGIVALWVRRINE